MNRDYLALLSVIEGLRQEGVEEPYTLVQIRDYAEEIGIDIYLFPGQLRDALFYLSEEGLIGVRQEYGRTVVYPTGGGLSQFGEDLGEWKPLGREPLLPSGMSYAQFQNAFAAYVVHRVERAKAQKRYREKKKLEKEEEDERV